MNIILGAIIVVQVILYLRLNASFRALKKAQDRESEEYMGRARRDAYEIIEEASKKAKEIISNAKFFSQDIRDGLSRKVDEELRNVGREATDSLKKATIESIEQFKNTLASETITSEKEAKDKIAKEYLALEGELAVYKKQKLESIERTAQEIVKTVVAKALGKSLDSESHKEAIVAALAEAKKTNVL